MKTPSEKALEAIALELRDLNRNMKRHTQALIEFGKAYNKDREEVTDGSATE